MNMGQIPKEWRDHLVRIAKLGGQARVAKMTPQNKKEWSDKMARAKAIKVSKQEKAQEEDL